MRALRLEAGDVHVWLAARDGFDSAGGLRSILAAYLHADPVQIRLVESAGGKPRLQAGSGCEWLRFSLSRSGSRAIVAVARDREVGADIERVAPERSIAVIADQLFSRHEAARLRAVPAAARTEAFFQLWTRKEAVLKALGSGLGIGPRLDQIDVASEVAEAGGRRWVMCDLPVGRGYAAALAAEGERPRVRLVRSRLRTPAFSSLN